MSVGSMSEQPVATISFTFGAFSLHFYIICTIIYVCLEKRTEAIFTQFYNRNTPKALDVKETQVNSR